MFDHKFRTARPIWLIFSPFGSLLSGHGAYETKFLENLRGRKISGVRTYNMYNFGKKKTKCINVDNR